MTGRERITAVLEGRSPDRYPFVPLIGRYYVRSLPKMGISLEEVAPWERATTPALKDQLNMHEVETIRYVHGDVLYRHVMAYRMNYTDGVSYFREEKNDAVVEGFETHRGTIFQESRLNHGTDYIAKHMIACEEDLLVYLEVLQGARPVPHYTEPEEMNDFIGDDGLITLTGPLTPIQEMLQFKMGVEATTFALLDHAELMKDVFTAQSKLNQEIYTILGDAPAEVVISYEDTSTTVLSPKWYEEHCIKELDVYAEKMHESGKYFITHMCGRINLLTNLIAVGSMDGIDSVCPPETGDLEPGDACRDIGKLIIGGLDPAYIAAASVKECREYARQKLEQIPSGAPFMLSTGDSTAAGTPVENLRGIAEVVREFEPH